MERSSLMQHWIDLFPGISLDRSLWYFRKVVGHYEAPGRYFHGIAHIENLLEAAALYFPGLPREVIVALWLHDVVYAPGSPFNEEDSAAVAEFILPDLGVPRDEVRTTSQIIVITKDHLPTTWQEAIVCDLDLLSLGAEPAVYRSGTTKIRREYAMVTAAQWRAGRKRFIRSMLDRDSIYSTPEIRARFELPARYNLQNELEGLQPRRAQSAVRKVA